MSENERQMGLLPPEPGAPPAPAGPLKPGRPAGARNKRGRNWQAYAATLKVHPLMLYLADVNKTDLELAEELKLYQTEKGVILRDDTGKPLLQHNALLQARHMRYEAARQALPYIEQQLPKLEEGTTGDKRILMIVGNLTPEQQAQVTRAGLQFALKENQGVSDAEIVQSDDAQSDDGQLPSNINGEGNDAQ